VNVCESHSQVIEMALFQKNMEGEKKKKKWLQKSCTVYNSIETCLVCLTQISHRVHC